MDCVANTLSSPYKFGHFLCITLIITFDLPLGSVKKKEKEGKCPLELGTIESLTSERAKKKKPTDLACFAKKCGSCGSVYAFRDL